MNSELVTIDQRQLPLRMRMCGMPMQIGGFVTNRWTGNGTEGKKGDSQAKGSKKSAPKADTSIDTAVDKFIFR